MKRSKKYSRVWFDVQAVETIVTEFQKSVKEPIQTKFATLKICRANEEWGYDTLDEFLAELGGERYHAYIFMMNPELTCSVSMWDPSRFSSTEVEIESSSRQFIIRLGNTVDNCAERCFVPPPPEPEKPPPPKPKIFIGHGGSDQWRDLKDHLQDQHGYEVIAYETGSRAGHTIRDIVSEMLKLSSFAILVMTGEDPMEDGKMRARQNVIHEIGLFQGHLGFSRAIVLKEDGTDEFSNLAGVHQMRYSRGNIKETFGDVLAVLRREFGEDRKQ
ncbi:MAG: nucleotide-binding protein [Planctomycetota bacterium]